MTSRSHSTEAVNRFPVNCIVGTHSIRCQKARFEDEILGGPRCTGPSTNATCQPEKPENWYSKTWGSASTLGLSLHPRAVFFPTGETARRAKTCGMWRIQARRATSAAVKIMGVGIWYADSMAPYSGPRILDQAIS